MDRREILQACLTLEQLGLEIGPLHNAICPKRDGWNVLIVDFQSADALRRAYGRDPGVDVALIEEVDIIAGANLLLLLKPILKDLVKESIMLCRLITLSTSLIQFVSWSIASAFLLMEEFLQWRFRSPRAALIAGGL